ncbi:WASH complex subunit 2 isoform X1 [Bactrocera dorsalis]|uniref:WASH complex subunit 2 isoform X1 n=1 Tax=Bactrocera dorsalis TaxID=27457 RepID=A0ABM3JCK8_BACDO|nr:WASH complex subunit 2 isoform X1 [Bactrocera dorsalis]
MEENAKADKVISQATQWSFEGDCSLLAWMQELSQHIEQRATTTNDALQQLNKNVKRTAIALDNAANSLTALQYTQFVESRCHDDDETQTTTKEIEAVAAATSSAKTKSQKEVLETFMQKNLQMLHNCHEKYALDFEDSDEDDNTNTNNYIYQPKNPYNDALLPHIYGSKLWKEHWHVGLCDGSNEYSGDEASDAFSESSSSSAADNESYESNTANLSEWASSTSIPIQHKHPAMMVAQKEHALPAAAAVRNKHLPSTQHMQSNDDSDTCSTTSRSTTTNPPVRIREHDLFAALRHDTPITSTSTSSSPQQHIVATTQAQRTAAPQSSTIAPFFDVTPPTDIFADAAAQPQPSSRAENQAIQPKSADAQIKRKPVNLFDDDDFNSFMTEVVDKAQTKAPPERNQAPQMPVPASRSLPSRSVDDLPPARTVDLFAEQPSIKTPATNRATAPIEIEKPKETTTRKPVNLFDSPEGSPQNDALFTSNNKTFERSFEKPKDEKVPAVAKPSITAKSLFDDDDDDDDFLNVFGAKKLNLPQRSTGKTLLFDDDNEDVTRPPTNTRTTSNLFDDTPTADDFTPTTEIFKQNNNKTSDSYTANGSDSSATARTVDKALTNTTTTTNATSTNTISKSQHTLPAKPASKPFSANLFADDENDDLDELFSKKSTKQQPAKTVNNEPSEKVAITKPISNVTAPQKKSLFGDDLVDDDDDLFGKPSNHSIPPSKASLRVENRTGASLKSATLFGDDFDDDDLFAVKPVQKVNTSTAVSKDKPKTVSIEDETTPVFMKQKEDKSSNQQSAEVALKGAVKNVSAQKSLFEEDDLENANDIFNTAKKNTFAGVEKVKEDSNDASNEVKADSGAIEPTLFASISEEESAELKPPAINGLLSEGEENISKSTQKTPIADVTTEQKVDNDENIVASAEEIFDNLKTNLAETEDTTVDTMSTTQKSTPNKEEIKEAETFSANWKHDENNAENKLDPISEHTIEHTEEPVTSQHITEPIAEVADTMQDRENTAGQQQKYASIFLDEPPDDDDFFTTLSNNTKPLSVSKLTLDLESDFYEPALPQVPNSARTTTTAATTNTQAGASDYGGLRLFSEIPPDDDDDDEDDNNFNSAKNSKPTADNGAGVNQRLHSVFYDDFSETLEAVQQIKENKIAVHALFDDEPPPDEEPFAIRTVETPTNVVEIKAAKADTEISEVEQEKAYMGAETSKDVTDRAVPKLEDSAIPPAPEKLRAPAGKLQMPKIKINVQALLPGGGGRPSFKKSPTTPTVSTHTPTTSEISLPPPAAELSKAPTSASLKSTISTESANESLLPSVCKTRVRAPAGRRPSTRRARQENYRQSLIAEQSDHLVEDASSEAASSSSRITRKPTNQNESESRTVPSTSSSVVKAPASINIPKPTNLFPDEDADSDDYDTLFKPAQTTRTQTNNNAQQALHTKTANVLSEPGPSPQTNPTQAATKSKVDFVESDGDDDDDLFKSVRIAPTSAALSPVNNIKAAIITTTTQSVPPTIAAAKSLFGNTPSEDSDDDLFKSNKSPLNTAARTNTKAPSPLTTTATAAASASRTAVEPKLKAERKLDSIFGSDDEDDDFLSQLKPKKKATASLLTASAGSAAKPSSSVGAGLFSDIESDEDDLFGAKSKTKQTTGKTKAATTTLASASNKQKPITTKQQPLDKQKTLADNPLADLLNP